MGKNICFLFGAGAECGDSSFGLPSGSDYTLKTMQHRHEKLYRELRKFYNNRLSDDYVQEYQPTFLFEKDSHTFREIIHRAARAYIEGGNEILKGNVLDQYVEKIKESDDLCKLKGKESEDYKQCNTELRELAKDVYDLLVKNGDEKEEDNQSESYTTGRKTLKDYLLFYGAVEKDFSAIINPTKVGLRQFWRVINYYWSAFFTILEPLCTNFLWYKGIEKREEFYRYVLSNLENVIHDIYAHYEYDSIEYDVTKTGDYYKAISDSFPDGFAITTNYTPFVDHYFKNKCAYLAGRLSEFEIPKELSVKDLNKTIINSNDFIFPFLMTQAPIKPIIVPNQIREYSRAIQKLEKAGVLVIIGYSLGEADNHINAILHEFAKNERKKIVYCYYDKDGNQDSETVRQHVTKALKMKSSSHNIETIANNGNAEILLQKLKKIIYRV